MVPARRILRSISPISWRKPHLDLFSFQLYIRAQIFIIVFLYIESQKEWLSQTMCLL